MPSFSAIDISASALSAERFPMELIAPSHPDAGPDGYVRMPNISPISEMVNMIAASRAYEANVAAITNYRRMAEKALSIGQV